MALPGSPQGLLIASEVKAICSYGVPGEHTARYGTGQHWRQSKATHPRLSLFALGNPSPVHPLCILQVKQMLGKPYLSFCKVYAGWVNKELASNGLRYDDLYDPLKDEVRLGQAHGAGMGAGSLVRSHTVRRHLMLTLWTPAVPAGRGRGAAPFAS